MNAQVARLEPPDPGSILLALDAYNPEVKRVLLCTFPFPPQTPPVQVASACEHCPNADRNVLDAHATLDRDDPDLQVAIRRFAEWFYHPDVLKEPQQIEETIRYAADLYTRADHTGTCIPKTILFAHYKGMQFNSYEPPPRLSDEATAALRGEPTRSWPGGEVQSGRTWNELFQDYTARYD